MSVPGLDAKAMIRGPAVVLVGAGPARRPPGCRSRWSLTGLDVRHDGVLVARHTRSLAQGGSENLVLDHYLEVLVHRPGALAGATALVILAELPKVHGQVPQAGC